MRLRRHGARSDRVQSIGNGAFDSASCWAALSRCSEAVGAAGAQSASRGLLKRRPNTSQRKQCPRAPSMNGSAAAAGADVQIRAKIVTALPDTPLQPLSEATEPLSCSIETLIGEENTCRCDGTNLKISNTAIQFPWFQTVVATAVHVAPHASNHQPGDSD